MRHPLFLALPFLAAIAASLPKLAAAETPLGVSSLAEAKAMYEHDVQACKNGAVDEDKRTCLEEARRAYDDARREVMSSQHHSKTSQQHAKSVAATDAKTGTK